jgi:hypothetical protein
MKIALTSGAEAEYVLREPDSFPSTYFFSLERAGSSVFWFIVTELLKVAHRSYCEPLSDLFLQGIARSEVDDDALRALLAKPGYAFGMFRSFDIAFQGLDLTQSKKFLLVRDPRDILVSLYFSMAGSHPVYGDRSVKDQLMTLRSFTTGSVGEFVRCEVADRMKRRYEQYRLLCEQDDNVVVFRYEDVIFNKLGWVAEIARHMSISLPSKALRKIARRNDLLPLKEDPSRNVRQVSPGNWRTHLDEETTAHVEQLFAAEMAYFGYVPEVTVPEAFHESLPQFCKAVAERLAKAEHQLYQASHEYHQTLSYRIFRRLNPPT